MLAAARVTLKQHRFEVASGVLLALLVGAWALLVQLQLDGLHVAATCVDNWLGRADGPEGAGPCAGPMHAWGSVLAGAGGLLTGEGALPISAMGLLPFAVGLLGGIPIIASELEGRTAQTAWSLNPSRFRWLLGQAGPVAVVLGAAIVFPALAATSIAASDAAWGHSAFLNIGLHGPLVLARTFSALAIGLLVGALLGRTLPAFILGAALSLALLIAVGMTRDAWLSAIEPGPIAEVSTTTHEIVMLPRAVTTGWGWITPQGALISSEEAVQLVPPEIVAKDPPEQASASGTWLEEHGYVGLPFGVTQERAMPWATYDALIYLLVGVASFGGATVLLDRRRPT